MKKAKNYTLPMSLACIIIFFAFIITGFIYIRERGQLKGEMAHGGVLNLVSMDLDSGDIVTLSGEWEFYWKNFLTPEYFAEVHENEISLVPEYIKVPDSWNGYKVDGKAVGGDGFGTYRLRIKTDGKERTYGLKILTVVTAYRLWVNGEELLSVGTVGRNYEDMVPKRRPQVVYFTSAKKEIEIVVQVSNFYHRKGGLRERLEFGTATVIGSLREKNMVVEAFFFGSIFIMGLCHLIAFFLRPEDKSSLFFSLFCLVVGIRTMLVGEGVLLNLYPNISWGLAIRLEYLAFYLGIPLFVAFIYELYPGPLVKNLLKILIVLGSGSGLTVILATTCISNYSVTIYQVITVLSAGFILLILFNATRKKAEGALLIFVSTIILVVTAINDILGSVGVSQSRNYTAVGLFIIIIAQSFIVSTRYAKTFNRTEEMSRKLKELNNTLERQVRERTFSLESSRRKLEKANKMLQQISFIDGLTNVSNRRHFDVVLPKEWEKAKREGRPLSLIIIDIDFFKKYNDTYGHLAGDDCLKRVARTLKETLRSYEALVARFGGEEFIVLLPNTDETGAYEIGETLRKNVEALKIVHQKSKATNYITISVGVATARPEKDTTKNEGLGVLVWNADKALYKAKQAGRNMVIA